MSAECDENFDKSEQSNCFFFCFLKEATLSFFIDAVDIFGLLLKNVDFTVFISEYTKSHI